MPRILILHLEGPLAAFGAEMVDARGPVRDWPGASLLTGLLANALGYDRADREAHDALQTRLDFAVRLDRPGEILRDFQTVQLDGADRGWTTRGIPEERSGGADTYKSPHIRERDHYADVFVTVALALSEPETAPTLDDLAEALERPARPLFLGRKPCLPSAPLFGGFVEAEDTVAALSVAPLPERGEDDPVVVLRDGPGRPEGFSRHYVTDMRNWRGGVHAGQRVYRRGRLSALATRVTS